MGEIIDRRSSVRIRVAVGDPQRRVTAAGIERIDLRAIFFVADNVVELAIDEIAQLIGDRAVGAGDRGGRRCRGRRGAAAAGALTAVPGEASAGFASAAGVVAGLVSPCARGVRRWAWGSASAGLTSAGLASAGCLPLVLGFGGAVCGAGRGVVAASVVAVVSGLVSDLASGVGAAGRVVTVPVVSFDWVVAAAVRPAASERLRQARDWSLCWICAAGEVVVVSDDGAGVAVSLPELDAGSANVRAAGQRKQKRRNRGRS